MQTTQPEKIALERIEFAIKFGERHLDLSFLNLTSLPSKIYDFKKLEHLDLSSNKLKTLSLNLDELKNLSTLDLSYNNLTTIKFIFSNLHSGLKELNISNNKLTALPKNLDVLTQLRTLFANDNLLSSLPKQIAHLYNLYVLDLQNNPLNIPPEILKKVRDSRTIIDYYFRIAPKSIGTKVVGIGAVKPLNQIKLLFVGQGSVGKTSIIQQILHGTFNQNKTKTEGISISEWEIAEQSKPKPRSAKANIDSIIELNIWDFGGQEIMHATHQFFLTKRSLYLLVLDSRLTQEENRVEYWLKIIQSFGGESPVLIIGNKVDQHPLDIDRTGLQKKYPNIVGILETSAAIGTGIEELKAEIAKQVDTLPHVRDLLPETWFTVKSKLEELAKNKNFFTQDEYFELCNLNEVTDEISKHTLIGFLHDLGVVLHFQDDRHLANLGILNPQWVTNGVYKILNDKSLFKNKGILTLPLLDKILNSSEYPQNKRLFIV